MNYDNNSNRPEGVEGNFSVAGPDDVLAELDALPDCCEEESDQDGYSRIVTIDFPIEVGHLYGVSSISVSVRDLLTWFAAGHPDESKLALNIRDDFYAGNSEEDHCYYGDPSRYMPPTPEEMAVLRVALDKGRSGRALKREVLEADAEANRAAETAMWLPFQAEREALQAEQQVLFQRRALLDPRPEKSSRHWLGTAIREKSGHIIERVLPAHSRHLAGNRQWRKSSGRRCFTLLTGSRAGFAQNPWPGGP